MYYDKQKNKQKEHMNRKVKIGWNNITLFQFKQIQETLKIEDETEKILSLVEIVLGKDAVDLPLVEFKEAVKQLDFMKEEIPESIPPKNIEINGRKYFVDCLLGNISTAQYVDYINHMKTEDLAKMLSVFVMPEGHKYNDGYDMMQVISDINDLPIPVVNSIAFFFVRQFKKFMEIFQYYSVRKIRKMNLPKMEKKRLIELTKKSMDLALYHLS